MLVFCKKINIPRGKCIETATIDQLVEMLVKRRIDALVFARISVMTLLQENKITGIYYQSITKVPASLAVYKYASSDKLKQKLDNIIK
jgi:ABC-type amino acid transport substrate-binding protein